MIDARTEQRIAEIPLGGDAGDIEYDAVSHRIYAVVATLNRLVTIDPVTDKIKRVLRWQDARVVRTWF